LFITPDPVFCSSARKFAVPDANKQAKARMGSGSVWILISRSLHQTLRVTPAMEAGISDHVWTLEEIINLLDK
jgi:hypothetical protein